MQDSVYVILRGRLSCRGIQMEVVEKLRHGDVIT